MIKLASIALIVATGSAGAVQACPSASVAFGVAPRVAYAPVVYAPYWAGYGHEWRRERHWYRDRDWDRDHDWDRYRHGDHRRWPEREWERR